MCVYLEEVIIISISFFVLVNKIPLFIFIFFHEPGNIFISEE